MSLSVDKQASRKWSIKTFSIASLISLAVALLLAFSSWSEPFEWLIADYLVLNQPPKKIARDIVIVAIDEPSMAELNRPWPWPRGLHADLLNSLYDNGARLVALDILFIEPSDPAEDNQLRKALERYPQTLLAEDFIQLQRAGYRQETLISPRSLFADLNINAALIGLPVDADGVVRSFRAGYRGHSAFAVAAAKGLDQTCCDAAISNLPEDRLVINFAGPPQTIHTVSYYQALEADRFLPDKFFKDKLVLVGAASPNLVGPDNPRPDYYPVPHTRQGYGYMAGVEIHAQAVDSLLNQRLLRELDQYAVFTAALLLGMIWIWTFHKLSPATGFILLLAALIALTAFAWYLLSGHHRLLPVLPFFLPPVFIYIYQLAQHYYQAFHQRNFIRHAFAAYLSPNLLKRVIADPNTLSLGGQRREVTVFFSDIRGFTTIAEATPAEKLVPLLNRYLSRMTDIIMDHRGTLEKYIGDAIMALYNAPLDMSGHAQQAADTALAMLTALEQLNIEFRRDFDMEIHIGIGLHTGKAVVGNLGSERHVHYAAVGDTVNLGARLEGQTKTYGVPIIISEAFRNQLDDNYACRKLDQLQVKGKQQAVVIYELMRESPHQVKVLIERYENAMSCYLQSDFSSAINLLENLLSDWPEDGPAKILLNRCQHYRDNPPPADWNGVFRAETK